MEVRSHKMKTVKLFLQASKLAYVLGATNTWDKKELMSQKKYKLINTFWRVINTALYVWTIAELGSFVTQSNLSKTQKGDCLIFTWAHLVLTLFFISIIRNNSSIRKLLVTLAIELRNIYNDKEVESELIKKFKFYVTGYGIFIYFSLILKGIDGLTKVIKDDGYFITIITIWPSINDSSLLAGIFRVLIYFLYTCFMSRTFAIYIILMTLIMSLSSQYKNMQRYFISLNDIFKKPISQTEKETEYERALILGIKCHQTLIKCTKDVEKVCSVIFSGQLILNLSLVSMLLWQILKSDHAFFNIVGNGLNTVGLLIATGFLMWSAGDVTVEGSHLPVAIFHSGWHNCTSRAAVRIRPLIVIMILRSQVPAELKCVGIIKLSYASYVRIVKSSYSIFSVLY